MLQPPLPDSNRMDPTSNSTMYALPAPHRTDSQHSASDDSQASNTSGQSLASDMPATNTTGQSLASDMPATNTTGQSLASYMPATNTSGQSLASDIPTTNTTGPLMGRGSPTPGPPVPGQTLAAPPSALSQFCQKWNNQVAHVKAEAKAGTPDSPTPGGNARLGKGVGKKNAMKVVKAVPKQKAIRNGSKKGDKKGAKKAEPRNDSSKAFDKTWFKTGGPKYYGSVTVYVDKKTQKYRIKPGPGSRQESKVVWGTTDKQQLVQWKKVLDTVRDYNKIS